MGTAETAELVFEAYQADVFWNLFPVLAEAFARAEREFVRGGEDGGHRPLLFEYVGYGRLAVFKLIVGEGDSVHVRFETEIGESTRITPKTRAVPGARLVS